MAETALSQAQSYVTNSTSISDLENLIERINNKIVNLKQVNNYIGDNYFLLTKKQFEEYKNIEDVV